MRQWPISVISHFRISSKFLHDFRCDFDLEVRSKKKRLFMDFCAKYLKRLFIWLEFMKYFIFQVLKP